MPRKSKPPVDESDDLFPSELLSADQVEALTFRPIRAPVWSDHKARLIERYLYYFVMITHHGTYIDGFSGPQAPDHPETWSAKRVIESRPRFLRNFFLGELDPAKVTALRELWASQPPREKKEAKRTCQILEGDFNARVDDVLSSGLINEKEAAFALLDQRTFECHWSTVKKLAAHKKAGNKIELFYFLAVKWLHRAFSGVEVNKDRVDEWWGNSDWPSLKTMKQFEIAQLMTKRMKSELGYRFALPFPIYEHEDGAGSIMYYMIHATDHQQAPGLMWRAYGKAVKVDPPPEQGEIEF